MEKPSIEALLQGNTRITDAISAFSKEESHDNEHLQAVFESILMEMKAGTCMLFAATPEQSEVEGQNQIRITMNILKTGDGKSYAIAFTSQEEQARGKDRKDAVQNAVTMPIGKIIEAAVQNPQVDGVVINPWGESFIVVRKVEEVLLNQIRQENAKRNLHNEQIEACISQYYKDLDEKLPEEAAQNQKMKKSLERLLAAVLDAVNRQSHVLVAVSKVKSEEPETEGEVQDPARKKQPVEKIVLNHMKTSDGKDVLAAFTNDTEIRKGNQNTGAITMPIQNLLLTAKKMSENTKLDGVLLNVWGQRFLLTQPLISWILQAKTIQMGDARAARQQLAKKKNIVRSAVLGAAAADMQALAFESAEQSALAENGEQGTAELAEGFWEAAGMTFAAMSSMNAEKKLDFDSIMDAYFAWEMRGEYAANGKPLHVNDTVGRALMNNARGVDAQRCGEDSADNGALLRMLPFALLLGRRGHAFSDTDRHMLHQATALTHSAATAQLVSEAYALMLRNIENGLGGQKLEEQLQAAVNDISLFYENESDEGLTPEEIGMNKEALAQHKEAVPEYEALQAVLAELEKLQDLAALKVLSEAELLNDGSAVHTLEAAVWCVLNTDNYESCVEKSTKLGSHAAAVSLIAGSIAGAYYGEDAIPAEWKENLMRYEWIETLCGSFQKTWIG